MAVESVHDNWLYALTVLYDRRRVVLHSEYEHHGVYEFTDIVFDGVVTHHFEHQTFGDALNVILHIEETEPRFLFDVYASVFARTKPYGWPVDTYADPQDLADQLTRRRAKAFEVTSSCGLAGFVFAKEMNWIARAARYEPGV